VTVAAKGSLLVREDEEAEEADEEVLDVRVVVHDDGDHPHVRQVPEGGDDH